MPIVLTPIAPALQVLVFIAVTIATVVQWEGPSGTPQWFIDVQKQIDRGTGVSWKIAKWAFSFMVGVAYVFFVISWSIYIVSPQSFHPEHSNPWNLYAIINGLLGAFLVLFKRYGWMMHAIEPDMSSNKEARERSKGVTVFLAIHAFVIWAAAVTILSLACYYFEVPGKHNSFFIAAWVIIVVITTIGFIVSCLYVWKWMQARKTAANP